MKLRQRSTALIVIAVVLISLSTTSSALLYETGSKWRDFTTVFYKRDPNLDAALGILGSSSRLVTASDRWSQASWFRIASSTALYDGSGNIITTANFITSPPLCGPNDAAYAAVCLYGTADNLTHTQMYFNNSPSIVWNTTGTVACSPSVPRRMDFLNVAIHEFGHFVYLDDKPAGHPEAIMNFNCTYKVDLLSDDDTAGATQLYGPETGFEFGEAVGYRNILAYSRTTTGYYGIDAPELGPVSGEFAVPVISGAKYERIAGMAQSSYSYAYFKLFTADYDTTTIAPPNYLKIKAGMKLRWRQYNYKQNTMSVDFIMTDGTTLRDSYLKDQNGVYTHPALRGGYPLGQWLYFEVDLTPLAGKKIRDWLIAYDNGAATVGQQFRGYFDDIKVVY